MYTRAAALSATLLGATAWGAEPAPAAAVEGHGLRRTAVAVAPGVGYDFLSRQGYAGLDVAFMPEQARGFSFIGRLRGAYAFDDQRPMGVAQAGFVGVVPAASIIPRIGLIGHLQATVAQHPQAIGVAGDPNGDWGQTGLSPAGLLVAEVGFVRPDKARGPAAWSFGLHAGVGLGLNAGVCEVGTPLDVVCYERRVAFIGGVTGRMRLHEGLWLEALVGPTPHVGIGYAFGVGRSLPR